MLKKLTPNAMYFISLIYCLIPIAYSYGSDRFVWTSLLTLLFAALYLLIIFVESPWLEWLGWLGMMAYILYTSIFFSAQMMMFFFYQSNLMTFRFEKDGLRSPRWLTLYAELIVFYAYLWYAKVDFGQIAMIFLMNIFALGMYFVMTAAVRQQRLKDKMQEQNQSINLLLADNERNRIGQDLHDTLGHVFAMLSVKSELALALLDSGAIEQARKEMVELHEITKKSMQEVRQIVQNLRQHTLEEELIILANILELAQVDLLVEGKEEVTHLSLIQENMLAMMLRELTNNLLKHSRASHCRICFSKKDQQFEMVFEDNGQGFSSLNGTELHSLRDRIIRLQGTLEITSQKDPTQIRLTIPLEEEKTR